MSRPSKKKKVLIIGIGGGADIIGTIPLKIHMEKKVLNVFLEVYHGKGIRSILILAPEPLNLYLI